MSRGTRHRSANRWLTVVTALALLATASGSLHGIAEANSWAGGSPSKTAIPLERTPMGVWIVTATLNGRVRGRFLLDTGATWCAVSAATAARLRLPRVGERIDMQTAGGIVPMPIVRLGSVEIGGRRARGVQAVILPDEIGDLDGVIGMNFLNEFAYAIDPRRALLELD